MSSSKRRRKTIEEEEGFDEDASTYNNDDGDQGVDDHIMLDAEEPTNNDGEGIYLCTSGRRDNHYFELLEWHFVDLKTGESNPLEGKFLKESGCSVLGEEIYFFGGYNADEYEEEPIIQEFSSLLSNGVTIYNTRTRKWRKGVSMLACRRSPIVVSLPDPPNPIQFYVFGGSSVGQSGGPKPWAEYYHSKFKKWKQFPDLPSNSSVVTHPDNTVLLGHALVQGRDQIVLWSFTYFAVFNTHDNTWLKVVPTPLPMVETCLTLNPNLVVTANGVLFWYYGNSLFAYDFLQEKNNGAGAGIIGGPVFTFDNLWDGPDFKSSDTLFGEPHLIATGNNEMSLVWLDRRAQQICYTYFLLHQDEGNKTVAKWTGTFHLLPFKKDYQVCNIIHCFQVVRSKDGKGQCQIFAKDTQVSVACEGSKCGDRDFRHKARKKDYVDSKFFLENTEKKNISLKNFCNTIWHQILSCRERMNEKREELKRSMLHILPGFSGATNWRQDALLDEFLVKHKQDCATIFLEKVHTAAPSH